MPKPFLRLIACVLALSIAAESVPAVDLRNAGACPVASHQVLDAARFQQEALTLTDVFFHVPLLLAALTGLKAAGAIAFGIKMVAAKSLLLKASAAFVPQRFGPSDWTLLWDYLRNPTLEHTLPPGLRVPARHLMKIQDSILMMRDRPLLLRDLQFDADALETWVSANEPIPVSVMDPYIRYVLLSSLQDEFTSDNIPIEQALPHLLNCFCDLPEADIRAWGWRQVEFYIAFKHQHEFAVTDMLMTNLPADLQPAATWIEHLVIHALRPDQARKFGWDLATDIEELREWVRLHQESRWGRPPWSMLMLSVQEAILRWFESKHPYEHFIGNETVQLFEGAGAPEPDQPASPASRKGLLIDYPYAGLKRLGTLHLARAGRIENYDMPIGTSPESKAARAFYESVKKYLAANPGFPHQFQPRLKTITIIAEQGFQDLSVNIENSDNTLFIPLRMIYYAKRPHPYDFSTLSDAAKTLTLQSLFAKALKKAERPRRSGMWPILSPVYEWIAEYIHPFAGYVLAPVLIEGGLTLWLDARLLQMFHLPYTFHQLHLLTLGSALLVWLGMHIIPSPALIWQAIRRLSGKPGRANISWEFKDLAFYPALVNIFGVTLIATFFLWVSNPAGGFWTNVALPVAAVHAFFNWREYAQNPDIPRIKRLKFIDYKVWNTAEQLIHSKRNPGRAGWIRTPVEIISLTNELLEPIPRGRRPFTRIENEAATWAMLLSQVPKEVLDPNEPWDLESQVAQLATFLYDTRDTYKQHLKRELIDQIRQLRNGSATFKRLDNFADTLQEWLKDTQVEFGRVPWFVLPRKLQKIVLEWMRQDFTSYHFRRTLPFVERAVARYIDTLTGIPMRHLRPWGWRWVRVYLATKNGANYAMIPQDLQPLARQLILLHETTKEIFAGTRPLDSLRQVELEILNWRVSHRNEWKDPPWTVLPDDLRRAFVLMLQSDDRVDRYYAVRIISLFSELPKAIAKYVKNSKDGSTGPFAGGPTALDTSSTQPTGNEPPPHLWGTQRTRLSLTAA